MRDKQCNKLFPQEDQYIASEEDGSIGITTQDMLRNNEIIAKCVGLSVQQITKNVLDYIAEAMYVMADSTKEDAVGESLKEMCKIVKEIK